MFIGIIVFSIHFLERSLVQVIVFKFNEKKAVQAIALLIKGEGSRIGLFRLIKLLYLSDRAKMKKRGTPIVGDSFVAMENGPVLSGTYDRLRQLKSNPSSALWKRHLRRIDDIVQLESDPGQDELSEIEIRTLKRISKEFKNHTDSRLWDYVHDTKNLPEYRNPGQTSVPISPEDILRANNVGFDEPTIKQLDADLAAIDHVLDSLGV